MLCFFGIHNWNISQKYLPSIQAKIVTDFITHIECTRCKKVKLHEHLVWDGKNMVDKG